MAVTEADLTLSEFITELELRTADPREAAEVVKPLLAQSKVLKIVPGWYLDDPMAFYEEMTALVGRPKAIGEDFRQGGAYTGERWLEIRYDDDVPDMQAYRHSKNAQPLHTDESYIEDYCDVMLFYCINKARRGGETTFVDGVELVTHLRNHDPDLFAKVTEKKLTYSKGGRSRTEKIIDLSDSLGPRFNFNYYCLDPESSDEDKRLNREFFDYLQTFVNTSFFIRSVGLRPMEAVLWWDHYVLHGRNAFEAHRTNDRFIWKTGINWVS